MMLLTLQQCLFNYTQGEGGVEVQHYTFFVFKVRIGNRKSTQAVAQFKI